VQYFAALVACVKALSWSPSMTTVERGAALNSLRAAAAIATAPQLSRLSGDALQYYRYLTTHWLDRAFLDLAAALDTNMLFECGAHEAAASIAFARSGKSAIAIEANPGTYEKVTKKAEEHGVIVLNCGVGQQPGERTFYVPQDMELPPNASFLTRPEREYDEVPIRVTTLDSLAGKYLKDDDRLAVWIDVEGVAAEVLRGGLSMMQDRRCKMLKVEVESQQFWTGQSLCDEVDAILIDCGLVPVLRDIEFPHRHNLIYVRSELVTELDELLIQKWAELASIKPVHVPLSIRTAVHAVRSRIMSEDSGPLIFHRVAAALGSISSARVIAMRRGTRPDRQPRRRV
jgi:FkbM family methyltransferase